MICSGLCVTREYPAGTSNKVESSAESEYELTSMVISIKEPGVDGGGGFWLFWSAVSSCFFFLPNSPPIPLAIAPLRLESLEFDEEDAEEEEAEELEFCAVPPDASCCPAM